MTEQRPRLMIRSGGISLDPAQVQWLRSHFEIVEEGDDADLILGHDSNETDPELRTLRAVGEELMHLSHDELASLNAVERLQRIERIATRAISVIMGFNHFEVRLIDSKTGQLGFVAAAGIDPLGVGERIYAKPSGNGISGYVASTGVPYLCRNVASDSRYTTGIENAKSSFTVPLQLDAEILGVLNIESEQVDGFSEIDIRRIELFARYLSATMHVLNLLIAERSATRTAASTELREEVSRPLACVLNEAQALRDEHGDDQHLVSHCDTILRELDAIRKHLDAAEHGPGTLLGMKGAITYCKTSPELQGRCVLVVDDDTEILNNITEILHCAGCDVIARETGESALELLKQTDRTVEVMLTDVKLPDLTGFELFSYVHEHHPTIKVVLMTGFGYDPHHSVVRASQQGLENILFKPFKATQLLDELRRVLGMAE